MLELSSCNAQTIRNNKLTTRQQIASNFQSKLTEKTKMCGLWVSNQKDHRLILTNTELKQSFYMKYTNNLQQQISH